MKIFSVDSNAFHEDELFVSSEDRISELPPMLAEILKNQSESIELVFGNSEEANPLVIRAFPERIIYWRERKKLLSALNLSDDGKEVLISLPVGSDVIQLSQIRSSITNAMKIECARVLVGLCPAKSPPFFFLPSSNFKLPIPAAHDDTRIVFKILSSLPPLGFNDNISEQMMPSSHFLVSFNTREAAGEAVLTYFQEEMRDLKWFIQSSSKTLKESLNSFHAFISFDEARCTILTRIKRKGDAKFVLTSPNFFNKCLDICLEEVMMEVIPKNH